MLFVDLRPISYHLNNILANQSEYLKSIASQLQKLLEVVKYKKDVTLTSTFF